MKPFRFFFRFTKDQQKGIMALFILIIIVQIVYFTITSVDITSDKEKLAQEEEWLDLQAEITALKLKKKRRRDTIYPFNPNYITDYKGYLLGLTTTQIDRLAAYRESGAYINSAHDFQNVTKIHDTLLRKLSPYFKFGKTTTYKPSVNTRHANAFSHSAPITVTDINNALEEDLVKVYGIGEYYAKLILKKRNDLGGAFVSMDQMDDFVQFSAEAKTEIKKYFGVLSEPVINKININTASLLQLSRFPYFNRDIAKSIITERSMKGKLLKIDDLLKISAFPVDKEKIIALYLEF
jgi:DNA uptake protein ComE-like DNA-binding protein